MATTNLVSLNDYKARVSVTENDNLSMTRKEFKRASEITGERLGRIERAIESLSLQVESVSKTGSDRADPKNLYSGIGSEIEKEQPMILRVRSALHSSLEHLSKAQTYFSEELVREAEMDLYYGAIRRVSGLQFESSNFQEALTLLLVALEAHVSFPYLKNEIVALRSATAILADNPLMSEDALDACIDVLESATLNLAAPFAGIDFDDNSSE
jgi:hypothetical protein